MHSSAFSARRSAVLLAQQQQVAEVCFQVKTDSPAAQQFWENYARKYWLTANAPAPVASTSNAASDAIVIYGNAAPPMMPTGLRAEKILHGNCWHSAREIWLQVADTTIHISDPTENIIRVWLGTTPYARTAEAYEIVMAYTLPSLLRRRSFFELHAAGLIAPQSSTGILLIGDSGSGKSTLATRLASNGWGYLSDDLLLLQQQTAGVQAWGLRRVFALTETTLTTCFANAPATRGYRSNNKHIVEPQEVFASTGATNCRPEILFFTTLSQAACTRLEPLSQSEAMMGLLRQSSWLCYDPLLAREHTQMLAQLAQQCRAFRLHGGRDLLEQPARAHELLQAYLQ